MAARAPIALLLASLHLPDSESKLDCQAGLCGARGRWGMPAGTTALRGVARGEYHPASGPNSTYTEPLPRPATRSYDAKAMYPKCKARLCFPILAGSSPVVGRGNRNEYRKK